MLVSMPPKEKLIRRIRPRLLLEDSIPRPLHGVNPRTLKGRAWWDIQRQKAYEYNNFHCHACGVHKRDAKLYNWLEAHELYDVNYDTHRTRFKGIVALCHCCHAIIHAGRTTNVYLNYELSKSDFDTIAQHGQAHFKKYKLPKTIQFRFLELIYEGNKAQEAKTVLKQEFKSEKKLRLSDWSMWRLEYDGRLYPPKFKSATDWSDFYAIQ